jgi:hypothetical protein
MIKKSVFGACILVLLAWAFSLRSFPRMASIASEERLSFFHEYHMDTTGFLGPEVSLSGKARLTFSWKKKVSDSSDVQFDVKVGSRRFSEVVIDWGGSSEEWKKLGAVGWDKYKANGWKL